MPDSAFVGQHPISINDKLVYRGASKLFGIRILSLEDVTELPHTSHHNRASDLIVGSSFTTALVIIITCSRLWVRKFCLRSFKADDWVIIPAAIGCVAYLSLYITTKTAGCSGKHIYNCTYEEIGWSYEVENICFPIFYFTVFLVKISIVLANRRITGMTSRNWQIAHWIYLALLLILLPICVLLGTFRCSPISTGFTMQAIARIPDSKAIQCLNVSAINTATRSLHIITDWLLLPVPIIIIWQLQMRLSQKIRLMLVFCMGVISSIASIMRVVLISRLTLDTNYDYTSIFAWDAVDISSATIVASLPALNGVIDVGVLKMKAWVSNSTLTLLGRIRGLNTSSKYTKDYSMQLSDKGSRGTLREDFNIMKKKWKSRTATNRFDESNSHREADTEYEYFEEHLGG